MHLQHSKEIRLMKNSEPCARHVIIGYLREMLSHKTGAMEGTDIEFVHDMRVASRRLRTALDDVAAAFPDVVEKKFKKRYKKIRTITRTMGAVRDLDVLIARFHAEKTALPEREQPDVQALIAHLNAQREAARQPMLTLFAKLTASDFETKFVTFFDSQAFDVQFRDAHIRNIIRQKCEDIHKWARFIYDAARRDELHEMRIAVRRLRYSMEVFMPTAEPLSSIVDLQRRLGGIHDCDVVLDVLTHYHYAQFPGIARLIAQTRETRKADYETFLEKWEEQLRWIVTLSL